MQREFVAVISHELMNPVTGIGLPRPEGDGPVDEFFSLELAFEPRFLDPPSQPRRLILFHEGYPGEPFELGVHSDDSLDNAPKAVSGKEDRVFFIFRRIGEKDPSL